MRSVAQIEISFFQRTVKLTKIASVQMNEENSRQHQVQFLTIYIAQQLSSISLFLVSFFFLRS